MSDSAEWLVRATIWLVLACYGVILWRPRRAALKVGAWVIGLAAFVAHAVLSFAHHYGWSWAVAWEMTAAEAEAVTGLRAGWGLLLNFAFGVAWALGTAMVIGSHRRPAGSENQRRWCIGLMRGVHGFLLFMVIQGGVVFAPPAARTFTLTILISVAMRALLSRRRGQ